MEEIKKISSMSRVMILDSELIFAESKIIRELFLFDFFIMILEFDDDDFFKD